MNPLNPTLCLIGLLSLPVLHIAQSQETWEERAAERFKPLTGEQKRQITQAQPNNPDATPSAKIKKPAPALAPER